MSLKLRFTKAELLKLFLVCALPVHFWAILIMLKDVEIILEKRDLWYGAGFMGYLLTLALLESVLFFIFILALSFLFPKTWTGKTPLIMATSLAYVIVFWALINQGYFIIHDASPAWFEWFKLRAYWRQYQLYPLLVGLVIVSAGVPLLLIPRSNKLQAGIHTIIEGLTFLAPMYLFLDALGIFAAVIRNLY